MESLDIFKTIVSQFKQEMQNVRANRPNTALVESIPVEYMDGKFPIQQLGMLAVLPPRTISITVWDASSAPAIAKAIENSGLGVTPTVDGTTVRFSLPPLTDERREELVKMVGRLAEDFRIRIRTSRENANKKIESDFKAKIITEDQRFKEKKKVQDAVDAANREIESLVAAKEKEIQE